jgi:protoheme IX farnesyltransferase
MKRTSRRALPSGSIKFPALVLAVGIGMVLFSIALSAVFNTELAVAVGTGAVIYICVYTIWLKPRTILNIVIGGAAGSMAVISGGAASHAWNSAGVLGMALLVFIWTPTHFWSLAMAYRNDYANAGFPMLPVKVSMKQAAIWVAIHTLTTGFVGLILGFDQFLGIVYFISVGLITLQLFRLTILLLKKPDAKNAFRLFKYSNVYLGLVQIIIIILPFFH